MSSGGKNKLQIREMAQVGLFTAVIAVCSWISVPAVVPFTMQTFAVFLAAGLLGMKKGMLTVEVYILAAAVGIPVLAGFRGGIGALLGTTGGYVIGFIFIALIMGYAKKHFGGVFAMAASMVLGLIVCYAFGTAWFMFVYLRTTGSVWLGTVLSWCVLPYIIPDVCKICLALLLVRRVVPHIGASMTK